MKLFLFLNENILSHTEIIFLVFFVNYLDEIEPLYLTNRRNSGKKIFSTLEKRKKEKKSSPLYTLSCLNLDSTVVCIYLMLKCCHQNIRLGIKTERNQFHNL